MYWITQSYCALWHHLEIKQRSSLPDVGPAILIANHTCGIDHLLLQSGCNRVLGFLIAREYYEAKPIHWLCVRLGCIPVRRDGHDLAATRAALRTLEEGRVVPVFPEGRILPTSGEELGEGKSGAAFLALQARVPVFPAYIRGTPRTNDVLKAVITTSNASVRFGPPIDLSDIPVQDRYDRETLNQVTERMMNAIRDLRAKDRSECERDRPTSSSIKKNVPLDRSQDHPRSLPSVAGTTV
ncbi:lysophospholipid acyltransferase family protein [Singulisphaera sp. PoT]|uniref:lysophospholipid acyltransferase family protein n=1 Tax=Singulisphaera sp. PoT TaxID=3411797 RepID=UPI003BF59252